jgi:hypothetical protein
MSRAISPQPGIPCFDIITIPMSLYRSGNGDDGLVEVSRLGEWGNGATSILQSANRVNPKHLVMRNAKLAPSYACCAFCAAT